METISRCQPSISVLERDHVTSLVRRGLQDTSTDRITASKLVEGPLFQSIMFIKGV